MPIYEYRCSSCGSQKDHLQKMSDPLLTDCPACGKPTYQKMVTAAGFQLKGSGWYVTDFKGGSSGKPAPDSKSSSGDSAATPAPAKTESSSTTSSAPSTTSSSTSSSPGAATT